MAKFGNVIPKDRRIYGNYQVLSPDGLLMFRCNEKKAKWYLNRNLADIHDDKIIKLNFTPNGLGNYHKNYGLVEMENKCVVCGTENYLTRHHIVPFCYRKHFPLDIKSHNFHDIVLLCVDCHVNYENKAWELKGKIANEYNVPINGIFKRDHELVRIKKINSCLLDSNNIPKSRVKLLSQQIKEHFGIKRLTKKKILEIHNLKVDYYLKTQAELVVEKIDNINNFIILWRKHFIENNNCNFLPKNWSVYNV